jgi:hypothetical protein
MAINAKKLSSKRTHITIKLWTLKDIKTLKIRTLLAMVCNLQFIYLMADLSIRL